ncbi:O-antigen ligase family protein [Saprospiraceae bacterium]|nr:O-antigen ligase family protein [Saprospiraceae bacterium]
MNKITSKNIFLVACAVWIIGMVWSRFAISLGMILMLVGGLWHGQIIKKLKSFFTNKYYLSVLGIFLIYFVTGLYSENQDYFMQRMRIKLPFLFLPFAFASVKNVDKETIKQVMYVFIGVTLTGVIWSLSHFLLDVNVYIENYSKGQILPTPIHHIRFSIMVALSIAMCIYLMMGKLRFKEKYFVIPVIVFLSIYLHILAVRSGLLTFYVMIISLVFYQLLKRRNIKLMIGLITGTVIAIFLSTQYIPTVKKKIGYTKYSLELFKKNENIRELSDSRRLGSIAAGIQIAKEHPIVGVGYGDLMDETNNYLYNNYPELVDLELLPHNQYITLTTAGIIGLILFLFFTIYPIFYLQGYKDFFFVTSQLMLFASFMVEHTIESQIGVSLYIFIILFCMKNMEAKSIST